MIRPDSTQAKRQEAGEYGSDNSEFSDLMAELKSYQPTASAAVRATAHSRALEISTDDWDILFRAVEERLRLSVGARPASTATTQGPAQARDAGGRVQAIVLECVAELEKLHAALKQERRQ